MIIPMMRPPPLLRSKRGAEKGGAGPVLNSGGRDAHPP